MGCFITFEGIEGCGKTTQIKLLEQHLAEKGFKVLLTREPGGCPIADQIRAILLDAANSAMTPSAELLLYAAARAQHVEEVIKPALADDCIVLCDRFTDATVAYQGYGRGLDLDSIGYLNQLATSGLKPQLTILLDCPVEVGLKRALARINGISAGAREERFELESTLFHQKVRNGYLKLAENEKGRFLIVDGGTNVDETRVAVTTAVIGRLNGN
ncbi:thymidylate kinase [Geotalea daltonii FRC-32]|uniref:Thymidylate kinase n=1 Tax=Geotalea daltonii (strain DSM 22248 / JCM 15807 / FRC-32) TaxID=316067 RepID=KTHY_GEODF|nr:dTMP kinase [Geotalea daltonii]B9M910.1 RecName: Full=Thymidylate kinase; AltName: Full=dTMP kinase [Geotalea daltonii FRC-32]ACM20506.1 thymidylate kinase [Geotalea daltonii FRC-32]